MVGALFALSLLFHFVFSYISFETSERRHDYEFMRDMFENWQSEFLQLLVQVVFLSFLVFVGSSQSREGQDRIEAKIDWVAQNLNPLDYDRFKKDLEDEYPKK